MSIEDVNYLYKNSLKDNAIIFIESSKRDKNTYPTPSEYTITFDNPFKYVYGVEILDASIPRTMYQIDKTNNNLKIVLGDANYHIYKDGVYDPDSHISTTLESTNQNFQDNYDNTDMNYIEDANGTSENSGLYGNGSLIWLRDITLDPEDVNIDTFISKLNKKFADLPLSTGNSSVSRANNKKITFRAVSNPSTNVSKILIYSGSDADSNGLIVDTIPFYILAYDSNISETLGFDEISIANSPDYNSTLTDLEKRNIYMLLNNITINDWNTFSTNYLVRVVQGDTSNPYSKDIWEGSLVLNITHPYDTSRNTLNDRDRTLLVLQKFDEINSTKHYNNFLLFEINIINKIFKSGKDKGDIGKYNLDKNPNNIYNTSYPDFKIPETIEYKVTWDDKGFKYELENKIIGVGDYPSVTDNPPLTFILGNNYKFDLSHPTNSKKFCFIKYTGISSASNNQIIRLFSGNQEKTFTAKNILTNPSVDGEFEIDTDDDTTANNLVITINNTAFSSDFKAGINTNLDFIFISHLESTLPGENDPNFTDISGIKISNFDSTPEFNFSFYSGSGSDATTNYDRNVILNNITRVGTPGTDGSYVQYNTTDTNYGNSPNTLFGTPNNFHYLSSPSIDKTITDLFNNTVTFNNIEQNIFNPHISSGNTVTLQRSSVNRVQTPGMVNLMGERLITVKSKNIEENLYKNESGTSSIGIALFKLGVSGYAENRLDFSNYKPKDFHPIGKLSFIDFRFEIDNNALYDFKGVNHNMLINIKYFVPHKTIDTINYTLNANYNPNFIDYKKTQYEKDDESEEELEELTNDFGANFLRKEKDLIYSSDEDLEYVEPNNNDYSDSDTSESSEDDEYSPANKNNMTPYHSMYNS
tara:strand:- start:737 stop:3346 length:2610 start_codon:yes stop_codon:yes gene_type:complete